VTSKLTDWNNDASHPPGTEERAVIHERKSVDDDNQHTFNQTLYITDNILDLSERNFASVHKEVALFMFTFCLS
jgi:hypothetical protein